MEFAFFLGGEMGYGLGEAKEMKMVDEEGAYQDDAPAEEGDGDEDGNACRSFEGPDDGREGLPENKEYDQHDTCKEDVCAAFDGLRDEAGPFFFEALAGHDAMLDAEEGDQEKIDKGSKRRGHGVGVGEVEGFRGIEVADETDEVEKGGEEDAIAGEGIKQIDRFFHCMTVCVRRDWLTGAKIIGGGAAGNGNLMSGGFFIGFGGGGFGSGGFN